MGGWEHEVVESRGRWLANMESGGPGDGVGHVRVQAGRFDVQPRREVSEQVLRADVPFVALVGPVSFGVEDHVQVPAGDEEPVVDQSGGEQGRAALEEDLVLHVRAGGKQASGG